MDSNNTTHTNNEGFAFYRPENRNFSLPSSGTGLNSGTTTFSFTNQWTEPTLVDTVINEDSIEQVFTESSLMFQGFNTPTKRVFKVVYSVVDGKWNKSERIYGVINPAQEEYYDFDQE